MSKFVKTYLLPFGRLKRHEFWIDDDLTAGRVWDDDIRAQIAASDLFILLRSPALSASPYIETNEWPAIRDRAAACNGLSFRFS